MRRAFICAFAILAYASSTWAHEVRPSYLQLRQTGADTYEAFWKVPAVSNNLRLSLDVQLPSGCANLTEPAGSFSGNAYSERWTFRCRGGLAGGTVRIAGLTATLVDVLVRVERIDGSTQVTRLVPSADSFVVQAVPHRMDVVHTYLVLGIEHILTGPDHLLFVSGLLLLVSGFWRMVKTVSAFTLSHTVTLTLATLGFVHVPSGPVEAVIALSILFVACEVMRSPQSPRSLAQRKPWLVAFSFGLLHGLGFASGLSAAGLPTGHIPLALGWFSAGVEVGHFSFVAAVLGFLYLVRQRKLNFPAWVRPVPVYAIGSIAAFWLIARVIAL